MSESEKDDHALFETWMKDVKPLGKNAKGVGDHPRLTDEDNDESFETEQFDIPTDLPMVSGDAHLEYFHRHMHPNDKRKLLQGKMRIEDTLDLHGCTLKEAAIDLSEFLQYSQARGVKCVCVIHGRGKLSGKPVLKSAVDYWLPQSKHVIAFCSAKPMHGGVGAVYVLLRA